MKDKKIRMPIGSAFSTICMTLVFLPTLLLSSCSDQPEKTTTDEIEAPTDTMELHPEFQSYYDDYSVKGSFVMYASNNEKYSVFNEHQLNTPFTPASTFKICNSLIGLETGVIPDEHYVIPWDGIQRRTVWDKDYDLKEAIKYSTVWYYQELARRVGGDRMQEWLTKANYGNKDTSGGIDQFWLSGGLRITPLEEIDFLRRMVKNELPFSERSIAITKSILLNKDTLGCRLYGKTGWGMSEHEDIGWFVGFVEKGKELYYFANCVQIGTDELEKEGRAQQFDASRREITYSILKDLNVLPTNWEN